MTRRLLIIALTEPLWQPPGIHPAAWRRALADDVVDLATTVAEVDAAVACVRADRELAAAVVWPTMTVYEVPTLTPKPIFQAAADAGYGHAAILFGDAPDLPVLTIGKLLRPLTSRPVAVAPADTGGLLGIAATLPAPDWLPDTLDTDAGTVRAAAPRAADVAVASSWHRLVGPQALSRLDPGLEGWEATRALLSGQT